MFDKFRPVKLAGIAIIILAVVIYIMTGVRIRSVKQVQEEKETMLSMYSEAQHESIDREETEAPRETASDKIRCTIEIRCDNAVDKKSSISNPGILNLIPDDGCILKVTEYQAEVGFTVYDVLNQVALMNDIDIVSNSVRTYVSSIGGLAQNMVGTGSGWTYRVNDEMVMRPACYCKVEDGDVIKWIYVTGPSD